MNEYQWAITGAAIGAIIGWAVGIAMRQMAFKKAFRRYGPVPESLNSYLNAELEMFDKLQDRHIAQPEMIKLCEVKRELVESGRVGWTERSIDELVESVGARTTFTALS